MRRKRSIILVITILILILTSCGLFFYIAKPNFKKEKADIVVTEFSNFIFKYPSNYFSEKELRAIFNETKYSYKAVSGFLKVSGPTKLTINLEKGAGISGTDICIIHNGTITLYGLKNGYQSIIHEMTHVLAGRGPVLLSEGLAVYVTEKYAKPRGFPSYQFPADLYVLIACDKDIYVPLNELAFKRLYMFRGSKLLDKIVAYEEAGSFVRFLIEKYGLDKFKQIYQDETQNYEKVYNKVLFDLESEWIESLQKKSLNSYEQSRKSIIEGFYYEWSKMPDRAINSYKKALVLAPKDSYVYYLLSECYLGQGSYNEAIEYAQKAIEIEPYDVGALICLAKGYLKEDNVSQAIFFAKKALKNIDKAQYLWGNFTIEAYSVLGEAYFKRKDIKEGNAYFNKAIELSDDYMRVIQVEKYHYNLGLFFKVKGDIEKAKSEFRIVIESDKIMGEPKSKYAKEAEECLNGL